MKKNKDIMCRTVFRMLLIFASCCYYRTYAGQRTWQGSQRDFLLPNGQYEELYCNCWYYTPWCANVCKNYITLYGPMGRSLRPVHMKTLAFNPSTTHYQGPGAILDSYAAYTAHQADVYPGHFPMRYLNTETNISSELLGKRISSAQGPRKIANKSYQPMEMEVGSAQNRSPMSVLQVFSGKNSRNTNAESNRRMCELLVWIHQAGANSTDRRQRALLKGILNHFFRSNNLTEIVCEARPSLASKKSSAYKSLYTITKEQYVDVFLRRTDVHVASSSALDVLVSQIPSRVLYSKTYYTTTITPITTIFTSLDEIDTEKGACDPIVNKQTSLISTMSKADIKQDALIVAGKVHERRSKIENILSSVQKKSEFVCGTGSGAETGSKYRTTFVWKTITPYTTKEVLKYPKTAYYTTTEIFTITPLTTIYVEDESIGAGCRDNGVYTGPGFTPADDINNYYEKKCLATQEDIPRVMKHNSRNSDITSQEMHTRSNTLKVSKGYDSTDKIRELEKYKSAEISISPIIVHSKAISVDVLDKELQTEKSSNTEKDTLPPSSINIKNVLDPVSVRSIISLHSDSSSEPKSTVGSIQNESTRSSLLATQYSMQSASNKSEHATGNKSPLNVNTDISTTTVLITTTVIVNLEKVLEEQISGIVHRKNMLYKKKEQNVDNDHEETTYLNKSDEDGNKDTTERNKREYEALKQKDAKTRDNINHRKDKYTRTGTDQLTISPPGHIEANKDTAVYTSVLQVFNAGFSSENVIPTVDTIHRNTTSVDANVESSAEKNATRKKTITKVFTILTEGESHRNGSTGLTASYTLTKNEKGDTAYAQASRSLPNLERQVSSQTREHMLYRTHLMDIPLVSAIVDEINAANSTRIVIVTRTKTDCTEYRSASAWENPHVVDLNTKTQEQRIYRDRGDAISTNIVEVQSVTSKDKKNTLLTIRNMVSNSMVFLGSATKEIPSNKSSAVDAVQKSSIHTRLGSISSVSLMGETGIGDSTDHSSYLMTHYLKSDAESKTLSTFPIVKKVDIDDNFGVEIKVEPV